METQTNEIQRKHIIKCKRCKAQINLIKKYANDNEYIKWECNNCYNEFEIYTKRDEEQELIIDIKVTNTNDCKEDYFKYKQVGNTTRFKEVLKE